MTPYYVGMKVVCVDDNPNSHKTPGRAYNNNLNGLTVNHVYTLRELCESTDPTNRGKPSCRLVEIHRPLWKGVEPTYALARFRPVHENRMKELRGLLAPSPQKSKQKEKLDA